MRNNTLRRLRAPSLVIAALVLFSLFAPVRAQAGSLVASGTADASSATAGRWHTHAFTPTTSGPETFELTWTGTGTMLRLELRNSNGQWLASDITNARPKTVTANLSAGTVYRLNVWAMSGAGSYELHKSGGTTPGGGVTPITVASGTLDNAKVAGPRWKTVDYTATATGPTQIDLTWPTAAAELRLEVRSSTGGWLAAATGSARPKSVTVAMTAGNTYRINHWAFSGSSDYELTVTPPGGTPPAAGDPRPNLLFIMTDDQRIDTMSVMPKTVSWLGDTGTTFTEGYVTTPSCCPSRATVLTGRYVHNNGVTNQTGPAADRSTFINKYLQDAGYFTGHAGKYLHYIPLNSVEPNWDRWTYFKTGYYDPEVNRDGVVSVATGEYSTNVTFDAAVDYVEDFENRDDDKPWFLHITPIAPHRQGWNPPVPEAKYANAPIPAWNQEPSVTETDLSDKPPFIYCCNITPQGVAATRDAQLRSLMTVDDGIDRLMQTLEDNGELENTLVIFTSDNGWLLSDHRTHEKFLPYKHSVRVPFIARWDGEIAAGATDDRFVGNVDIGPTFLKAAGITNTAVPMDGIDVIDGPRRWRRLTEYWQDNGNVREIPDWASLTTANLQYTEYYEADGTTIRFREYYDLQNDPYQLTNLYLDGNPANDPDARWMHDRLTADRTCVGTACP